MYRCAQCVSTSHCTVWSLVITRTRVDQELNGSSLGLPKIVCHPRVMSRSLPHLTLTTNTSSLSPTSPILQSFSPSHSSLLTHDPCTHCDDAADPAANLSVFLECSSKILRIAPCISALLCVLFFVLFGVMSVLCWPVPFSFPGNSHCTMYTSTATFSFRKEQLTVCSVPSENGQSDTSIMSTHPVVPPLHCRHSQWLELTDCVKGSRQGRSSSQQTHRYRSAAMSREPDHVGEWTRKFGSETLQWWR